MSPLFLCSLSLLHSFLWTLPEAEEYAVEGKTLMLYSAGPLTGSHSAAIEADAGFLFMLYGLPLGRGIVSLDCGFK